MVIAALLLFTTLPSAAALTTGCYLQQVTESTAVVCREDTVPFSGLIRYGLYRDCETYAGDTTPARRHETKLTGLKPDTLYYYRRAESPDTARLFCFRTAGKEPNGFRFLVFGDTRTDSAAYWQVAARMAATDPPPRFLIHVGDLTEWASESLYQVFLGAGDGLFGRAPLCPAIGNHDLENLSNWHRLMCLTGNERHWSMRWGNSAFHCIDNYVDFSPGSDQYRWLEDELKADSADPAVRHIFAWFHEPPFSTNAGHPSNLNIRNHLCPLFERFGVDIAFCGHVHAYEHSLVNRVHHIVSGGGGGPPSHGWLDHEPWTVHREVSYQYMVVDVVGDTVNCRGVRVDGSVFDWFRTYSAHSELRNLVSLDDHQPDLLEIRPNPILNETQFAFTVSTGGNVRLTLHDIAGRRVATVIAATLDPGQHEFRWQRPGVNAGSYFAVLQTPNGTTVERLVLASAAR